MHWYKHLGVIASLAAFMSGYTVSAHAEETGWYVGAGAGSSLVDIDEGFWSDSSITASDIETSGAGFQLYAGYRLHRHFALEVGYMHLTDTVFSGASNGVSSIWDAGPVEGRTEVDGISIQGLALWPLDSLNLALFLKGGVFMWDSLARYNETINDIHRFNDDGGSLIGGMGAEVKVWGDWRLRGSVDVTAVGIANREVVTAAIATMGVMHPLY